MKRPPTEPKDNQAQIEVDKGLRAQGALTKAEFREKYTLHPHQKVFSLEKQEHVSFGKVSGDSFKSHKSLLEQI